MVEKIQIYISLSAALIMTIVCIVLETPLVESVSKLVLTIVLFYIIGLFVKNYMKSKIFSNVEKNIAANNSGPQGRTDIKDGEYDDTSLDDYNFTDEATHENDYE